MSKPFIAERKPIEVIALRYDEKTNLGSFLELLKSNKSEPVRYDGSNKTIYIKKERGEIELTLGNWVIYETNTDKSFWAIDHDIFLKTYELVSLAGNKYRKRVYQVETCEFTSLEKEDIFDLIDFVGVQERGDLVRGIDKDEIISEVQRKGFLSIDTLEGIEKLFQENLVGNWTKEEAIQFIKEITQLEKWKVEGISNFIQKTPEEIISEVNTKISDKFISKVKVIENATSWKEIIFYFKNTTLLYSIKVEPDFQQKVMKLGKNDSGEWFNLSNFLNEFFLPLFTDWSPSVTVSESEFLNVLTKLNDFEVLKKKFDEMELTELTHNQVVDFFTETIPELEQSNLNFVLSINCLLCPKNCLVWYGSENPDDVLVITLTCEHPELKNQNIFKMQFHVNKKDRNGFCELNLTSNTIPSLLEAATIAYQFS